MASPVVADPLRLLHICATSDGGAAVVLCSMEYARKHLSGADPTVRVAAISTVTPTFPNTIIEMPDFATDSAAGIPLPDLTFKQAIGAASYEQAGIGPEDIDVAVYDEKPISSFMRVLKTFTAIGSVALLSLTRRFRSSSRNCVACTPASAISNAASSSS